MRSLFTDSHPNIKDYKRTPAGIETSLASSYVASNVPSAIHPSTKFMLFHSQRVKSCSLNTPHASPSLASAETVCMQELLFKAGHLRSCRLCLFACHRGRWHDESGCKAQGPMEASEGNSQKPERNKTFRTMSIKCNFSFIGLTLTIFMGTTKCKCSHCRSFSPAVVAYNLFFGGLK